jgi:hypothetical protein
MGRALALLIGCSLCACKEPAPAGQQTRPVASASAAESAKDAGASCLDAWLAGRGLNQYGDPPDTMYPGGTPLFDERTGQRKERAAYVLAKHPAAAQACPGLARADGGT